MVTNLMKYNPAFLGDEVLIRSFVARTSELERILEVLRENTTGSNQHLLVIGPRGIGKTTLVLRAAAEIRADPSLGAHWYPVVYGEETYQVSSAGEFWLEALFHIGQQTGDSRWQQAHEELLGERNEGRLRPRALAQLMDFADEQGKRLVLVVENLNMLFGGQIGDEDAWVLRHTLMNEPRIMLLGTATSRFRVMDEYNQALYELFRIVELEPLADDQAQAVWTAATGHTAPLHQLRPIQILTGGNPRLIRILSEFAAKTSFRSLMDDLTRLVDEHTEYFKHHLDNLPPQERKVFVVLADLWDPSTARAVADTARLDINVTSALLKRLMERGAVTAPYKRGRAQYYQVAERMYNIYHLMRRRGQASSRVHAVVRFMVSLYRDEELVRTTKSLVEEAARLSAQQRRDHLIACEAILTQSWGRRLTKQLVDAARFALQMIPEMPDSLRRLLALQSSTSLTAQAEGESEDLVFALRVPVRQVEDVEVLLSAGNVLSDYPELIDQACDVLRRAVKAAPENVITWRILGTFVGSQLHRPRAALRFLNRAIKLDPMHAPTWFNRGTALSLLDRDEEALASYNHGLELDPGDPAAWAKRGASLYWLDRFDEALGAFDRALAIRPDDAITWSLRGSALDFLQRTAEALESFERALQINSDDAETWSGLGIVLRRLNRLEEALQAVDNALALDPEYVLPWLEKGLILDQMDRFEEALECYESVVRLDNQDVMAWATRGSLLDQLGRAEEALESLTRALQLDPLNTFALATKGQVLADLKRFDDALECYDRALTIEVEADVLIDRAMALQSLGRLDEAEGDLRRAVSLNPTDAEVTGALVELLLVNAQKPEDALSAAIEIVNKPKQSAGSLNDIAWCFFKHGREKDWDYAEVWARSAVEQEPTAVHRHTWACLLGAQNRWEAALEQAPFFLADHEMLDESFDEVIDFLIDAVAAGCGPRVAQLVRDSENTQMFEPLEVAIRRLNGEEINVAREISEIAADVMQRINLRGQQRLRLPTI
jgi:tetratricopeptide (TPR) repeat protein